MWDLTSSRRWLYKFGSFGMWHHVVWCMGRHFSEEPALSVLLQTEGSKFLWNPGTRLPNWNGITSDGTVFSFAHCLSNALRPVSLGSWRKYFSVRIKVYCLTNDTGSSSNRVTRSYYDMGYLMKKLHACILQTLRINKNADYPKLKQHRFDFQTHCHHIYLKNQSAIDAVFIMLLHNSL